MHLGLDSRKTIATCLLPDLVAANTPHLSFMKTTVVSLVAVALVSRGLATTHAVLPGESIQAKVDIAVPGDIVAIFGGTYPDDVTVTKAIRLVEVDGQEVTLNGNVTF